VLDVVIEGYNGAGLSFFKVSQIFINCQVTKYRGACWKQSFAMVQEYLSMSWMYEY